MLRRPILACLLLGAAPLLGCQPISASLTSPSDWVAGTGESINGSLGGVSPSSGSGGGGAGLAYRRDVRAFTAHFARTGGGSDDFLRGVGAVAVLHGVTHWERQPDTQLAIGAGLREGGAPPAALDAFAASANLDPLALARVREGYASAR
jgi:hypothetical protein